MAGCVGQAVEAVMQFTRASEVEDKDSGVYVDWEGVLEHFKNDLPKAKDFVIRRRGETHGTGWVGHGVGLMILSAGDIGGQYMMKSYIYLYIDKYIPDLTCVYIFFLYHR